MPICATFSRVDIAFLIHRLFCGAFVEIIDIAHVLKSSHHTDDTVELGLSRSFVCIGFAARSPSHPHRCAGFLKLCLKHDAESSTDPLVRDVLTTWIFLGIGTCA